MPPTRPHTDRHTANVARPGRPTAALACCAAALLAAGCDARITPGPSPGPINAWAVNEMVKISSQTPRRHDHLIVDPRTGMIDLFAASNETASFQVIVQADSTPLDGLKVSWSELAAGKRRIDAANIRVFRMLPMRISEYPPWYLRLADAAPKPGDFYDALVPIDAAGAGQPFRVPAGVRLALWVDVYVPRGTHAGQYVGKLEVSARGPRRWTTGLSVKVYDFVLPDARAIAAVGAFDHRVLMGRLIRQDDKPFVPTVLDRSDPAVRRGLTAMRQLITMGHRHRLDLFDRAIHPILKRDLDGKVVLDWNDYDAIVLPYLNGTAFDDRVGCPAWCSPFSGIWPNPANYDGIESDAYAETAKAVVAQSREHFMALDAQKQVFLWPYRGPVQPEGYSAFCRLGALVRAADDRTPILTQLPAAVPPHTGWSVPAEFSRHADILAPAGQWFDAGAVSAADPNRPLAGTWLAPGAPPHFPGMGVLASPADLRAIPWIAMKYRCAGLLVPEVLDWSDSSFDAPKATQTTLFYPGAGMGVEGVLPSVRLKWLRRGLQDLAYLMVLRQRQQQDTARKLIDAMVRYAGLAAAGDHYLDARLDGWVQDAELWTLARRILAEEVQQAVKPTELSSRELLAQRLAWKDLADRTATVRVEQVRSRFTAVRHGKQEWLCATLMMDLYNEYDRPVDVSIKTGELPGGWESLDGGEVRIAKMAPSSRHLVVLTLQGPQLQFTAAGKTRLPMTLSVNGERGRPVVAMVPMLVAWPAPKPIRIDGKLRDWPLRPGNSAGEFVLVGRRGQRDGGLADRQTQAFILSDANHLYVAMRCREPNLAGVVARSDNSIRYEQLMACGEDLVEVILDPGAKARSPEELFHVAVKANGVVLAEHGIGTAAPLGRSAPWASGARVTVSRGKDEWLVEMALPLAAFGDRGRERFWGVNFCRFATQGAESSSWSQAARYFYHPRNLGAVFLPPPLPATRPAEAKETPNGK